jgi:hypothetical protein
MILGTAEFIDKKVPRAHIGSHLESSLSLFHLYY